MKKTCRKCAPKANPRPLFNFGKYIKAAITCKEFFYKFDVLKEDYQKSFKKLTLFFFRTACHLYVTRMYLYVMRVPLVCTRMSFVCHSYVIRMSLICTRMSLVYHPYVTRMYLYVIRMSLVCIRMSSVFIRMSSVCHSYVIRMWFYHEAVRPEIFNNTKKVTFFSL